YPVLLNAVRETVESMKEIECSSIFILSGNVEGRFDSQKNIIIENLKRLSELAEKENITINIEPVNSLVDLKGHYLDSTYIGFEIVKCVNNDHIKLIYDIYHAQMMEGNIIANITKNIDSVSHFHSAAVPGRNEHFLGELDYRNILKAIEKTGYNGYFGLEYTPSYEDHKKSLAEVLMYLRS
ncbi:MAG: TIM barrel protein, partial [Desulfobacterales bacterium]|nr:TIM barrel protein [Desulfobacterales bacterium]